MERQKNKSNVILIICILLHLSLFILQQIISVPNDKLSAIHMMLIIGVVYYAVFLTLLFWYDRGISLAFIFVAVSACFVLGHHIVVFVNPTQDVYLLMDYGISMSTYFDALFFILACVDWIILAYCFFMRSNIQIVTGSRKKQQKQQEHSNSSNNLDVDKILRTVGILIFIVSIPFTISFLYENITLTILYGYQARMGMEQNARNYVAIIAGFFPTSLYMILVSNFYNKFNRYFCLLMLGAYSVLYMFAGSRLNIIKILVVLLVIFYFKEGRLNFKKIIKLSILGYCLSMLFTLVTYLRSTDVIEGGILTFFVDNDPILNLFKETGTTFTTIANVINNCPNPIAPVYGKTYINQFFVIIPNLFFDRNPFQVLLSETFNPFYYYGGLSSSMFAEAYFNMLGFGFLYMIVIGLTLSKITKCVIKPKSIYGFLIAAYVYSELIWSIRFDTYLILRSVLYYIVIPYWCGKLFLRKK